MTLRRSKDRKVANVANRAGKQAAMANAFGLPAGKAYSCPGATAICEKVCYAGRLEGIFPSMRALLEHNWQILSNADYGTMVDELDEMVKGFIAECDKRQVAKAFRIHWDGDFFSRTYASAWANVIRRNPSVTFWVYTRSFTNRLNVIDLIADIPNLAVYLSVDSENAEWAPVIIAEYPRIRIAALAETMADAADVITDIRDGNLPGAKCPELIGALPMIDTKGGACFTCQLCPKGKADIRFSTKTVKGVRV